jgi:hypothetical protein
MVTVEKIRGLVHHLPEGDDNLAVRFIDVRDFESLKELVDSAIIRTKKSVISINPSEKYAKVDLDTLRELKASVDEYVDQLDIPSDTYNYDAILGAYED